MPLNPITYPAIILVVILTLTFVPNLSLMILALVGIIYLRFYERWEGTNASPRPQGELLGAGQQHNQPSTQDQDPPAAATRGEAAGAASTQDQDPPAAATPDQDTGQSRVRHTDLGPSQVSGAALQKDRVQGQGSGGRTDLGPSQGQGLGLGRGHSHKAPEGNAAPTPPTPPTHDPENPVERPAGTPAQYDFDAAGKKRRKSESSSTTSSSSAIKNGVFLNFHGPETRTTIMRHFHKTLVDVGIPVFRDGEELAVGEQMSLMLIGAIKQSRISIAILSTDYAYSRWCLTELVQMWDCTKTNGQTIIPIFYNVSPSDVINQAGDFGKAFRQHEETVDSETIKKWREVLGDIGGLPGYSGKLYDGYESQLAEKVVLRVARILRDDGLAVTDELVGINLHVQEIMRKLGVVHSEGRKTEVRGEDVRVIGIICGVPGVQKTTLAKVVFNKTRDLFDGCSFLSGISSKRIQFLRRMLIADLQMENPAPLESAGDRIEEIASLCRNSKVLIVLDDVDEDEQIKALAGKVTWFGPGSRIIVTTNNRKVLSAFDVGPDGRGIVEEHKIEPMSDDHALQLFRDSALEEVSDQRIQRIQRRRKKP